MTDDELADEVRRLRGEGASPKQIARALGVRPAVVSPLVRQLAAEAPPQPIGERDLAGCWVSPGWSRDLLVEWQDSWHDVDLGPSGPAGVALVLVARSGRGDRLSVCGYLVDTFCLGVKNVIGPESMRRRELPSFVRTYFAAFPAPALRAPIGLAQQLVHGAVEFARGLGLEPHEDLAAARGHLGELCGGVTITFGQRGRPVYIAGPHDDPIAVLERLKTSAGSDGFAVAA